MPPRQLAGSINVFSGFTDDALKTRLVNVGAIVMASVSGKTDIVIAHDLHAHWSRCVAQPKAVAIAKKKGINLYDIKTFRKMYFAPRIRHTLTYSSSSDV
jgi:hypothetical protein